MTIEELVQNKTYSYIECRCLWSKTEIDNGATQDNFFGACKSENGVIIPLDGDSYDGIEVEKYNEWTDDEGKICMTIWENGFK